MRVTTCLEIIDRIIERNFGKITPFLGTWSKCTPFRTKLLAVLFWARLNAWMIGALCKISMYVLGFCINWDFKLLQEWGTLSESDTCSPVRMRFFDWERLNSKVEAYHRYHPWAGHNVNCQNKKKRGSFNFEAVPLNLYFLFSFCFWCCLRPPVEGAVQRRRAPEASTWMRIIEIRLFVKNRRFFFYFEFD